MFSKLLTNILVNCFARCCASSSCGPARGLSNSSRANTTAVVVSNVTLNVGSATVPIVVINTSVVTDCFFTNNVTSFRDNLCNMNLSTMNVLSALNVALTASTCNPITSGTNNVTRVDKLPNRMERHASTLSSLNGAATTANGNFTVNSTTLATLTLVISCASRVSGAIPSTLRGLDVAGPTMLVNLFINTVLPFLFSTLAVRTIKHTTRGVIVRMHERFERVGNLLSNGTSTSCRAYISVYAGSSLGRVVTPTSLKILSPVVMNLVLN